MRNFQTTSQSLKIEKILKKMSCHGEFYYLCKWFDLTDSDSSWEPEDVAKIYPDKVKEFENTNYKLIIDEGIDAVEEIIACQMKNGEKFYLCKWIGQHHFHNTWEPESNVAYHYKKKLTYFKQKQAFIKNKVIAIARRDLKSKTMQALGLVEHRTNAQGIKEVCKYGFDRGLTPEIILAAVINEETEDKDHKFLIKWKDCDEFDIVFAQEARENCPLLVIEFYERNCASAVF